MFIQIILDHQIDLLIFRRGKFLQCYPESRQSKSDIINWINENFSYLTVVIFSDDHEFRDSVKECINCNIYEHDFSQYLNWEVPYIEFLILSYKAEKIYGTPSSSFAEEAGLFGGKQHYGKILF